MNQDDLNSGFVPENVIKIRSEGDIMLARYHVVDGILVYIGMVWEGDDWFSSTDASNSWIDFQGPMDVLIGEDVCSWKPFNGTSEPLPSDAVEEKSL